MILAQYLEWTFSQIPEVKCSRVYNRARDIHAAAKKGSLNVALLDPGNPFENMFTLARFLADRGLAVVFMGDYPAIGWVRRATLLSARGFLSGCANLNDYLRAVESVAAGRSYYSPCAAEVIVQIAKGANEPNIPTQRELDVLGLLAAGHSSKEIGRVMSLATRSVESYRTRLMHKFHARSTAALVRIAIEERYVDPSPRRSNCYGILPLICPAGSIPELRDIVSGKPGLCACVGVGKGCVINGFLKPQGPNR